MPDFAVAPPLVTFVPVSGGSVFPVRRVYCVGRNYAEHAREMGHMDPEPPFFFAKPADALVTDGAETPYPVGTNDLHHEIELVVAIGAAMDAVSPDNANTGIFGYAAGVDLTRRDIQAVAKKQSRPWEMAKAFDHSAPIGTMVRASEIGHPAAGPIELSVNGQPRQHGDIADMIWDIPNILAHLSALVGLRPGDLVFTGTPAGVGPLVRGDRLEGSIAGVGTVATTII